MLRLQAIGFRSKLSINSSQLLKKGNFKRFMFFNFPGEIILNFPILSLKTVGVLLSSIILLSCNKNEENSVIPGELKWMNVLEDTVFSSTDDELYQGRNGKVITDNSDNIYCYISAKNPNRTVVKKFSPEGVPLRTTEFLNCEPADMNILSDGTIVLAVRLSMMMPQGLVLYYISPDGSVDSLSTEVQTRYNSLSVTNAFICPLEDNTIIISGTFQQQVFVNGNIENVGFVLTINRNLLVTKKLNLTDENLGPAFTGAFFGQNSIARTTTGKYIFQFDISRNKVYLDSIGYGLLTGLLHSDGSLDTFYFYHTGYEINSTGVRNGFYNRYCNGLIPATDGVVFHYSSPVIYSMPGPFVQNGFLIIGNDALIKDTLPISLPNGYKILSCIERNSQFFMTSYRAGVASGTSDFSANQTSFITGSNWQQNRTFSLQKFYADFFPSSTFTSDGGYILMGKIQSFNGQANKLILIKWKD